MLLGRYLAYGGVYTLLEILAVPAVPLTMTAGVIFGPVAGSIVVSVAATTAATIAFLIARYAGALRPAALACSKAFDLKYQCIPAHTSCQSKRTCLCRSCTWL